MGLLDYGQSAAPDPNDLSGLLGLSPAELEKIMAQLQPSAVDKKAALSNSLLNAAAAAFSNMYKPTGMGLGAALGAGVQGYNTELKDRTTQRGQNLTQAVALKNAAQDSAMQGYLANALGIQSPTQLGGASGQAPGTPAGAPPAGLSDMGPFGVPKVALAAAMLPKYAKFGEMIAAAAKPENLRAGGSIATMGPDGKPTIALTAPILGEGKRVNAQGEVETIPGYIPSQQAIQTAQEAGKSKYEMISVPQSDGTTRMMPKSQFLSMQAGPITGKFNFENASPEGVQASLDAARGIGQPQGASPMLGTSANPVMLKAQEAEATGRAEALGKQPQAIDDAAQLAQTTMARTAEVRGLLKSFTPGRLTPLRGEIGSLAQSAGLPTDVVQMIAGGSPAAIEATTKVNIDNAFDSAKQALSQGGGGSRVTQAEILLKAKTQPGVALTPEANNVLLDFQDGVATRAMDMQGAKEDWLAQKGTMQGFSADFNKNHPLSNYVPSAEKLQAVLFPKGAPGAAQQQPSGPLKANATETYRAQQAIKNGADRAAVVDRMKQRGFDPGNL